ncbi:transporter substrate-binding domain-containing protein [Candidatus Dependentiae bacterium]|nr:transporter substrate-binding domain-containing protein [Candidatus Dependentiae bacterium]
MIKFKKIALIFFFIIFSSIILFADDTIPINKKKIITAAVIADFPPLYFLDENKKPIGLAIDIFEQISKNLGYEIKYKIVMNWAEALDSVKNKTADIVPGAGLSKDRIQNFKVSNTPLEAVPVSCFVRSGNFNINGIEDLKNKKTGVIDNSAAFNEMKDWKNYILITFNNVESALFSLLSGEIDAFVFPQPVLLKKAAEINVEDRIKIVGKPLIELKRSYIFHKDDNQFYDIYSKELKKILATEFYRNSYIKWYGKPQEYWTVKKISLLFSILIIFITSFLLIWKYKTTFKLYSELKNSENQYYSLVDKMTEMVVQHKINYDSNGKPIDYTLIDCNDSFCRITGLKKENVVGRKCSEIFNSTPPPYLEIYSNTAENGIPNQFETYYSVMDRHFLISVISHKKGFFATVTTDITENKKNENRMKNLILLLEAKNEEMENILYISSHDLRSPLLNIQGFASRIEKNITELSETINNSDTLESIKKKFGGDSQIKDRLISSTNYILTSAQKMDFLISGLLKLSRIGRTQVKLTSVKINKLFQDILKSLTIKLQDNSCEIKITDMPDCIGDMNLLNQVFTNLIDNAVKYKKKSEILKINISGKIEGNNAVYCIEDNGTGISENNLEKIWKLFYRACDDNSIEGEGLGLTIVKNIVQKHSGKVWVESELGKGTKFFISIPAVI